MTTSVSGECSSLVSSRKPSSTSLFVTLGDGIDVFSCSSMRDSRRDAKRVDTFSVAAVGITG